MYSTVRLPTCSQIPPPASALDNIPSSVKLNAVAEALARRRDYQGALRVLKEINSSGVSLDAPTLRAVIDAAVPAPSSLADILGTLTPPGYATVGSENMVGEEEKRRLVDPTRLADLTLSSAFMVIVGSAVTVEVVEPAVWHHAADEATSVLIMVMTGLLYDRYGGGGGRLWGRIVKGLGRFFSDDPVRKVRVDAAHFLVAYLLGIPWMCFRPDAQQVFRVHGEEELVKNEMDKYLVWMVAGVVVEDEFDGRLIESNLNEARALLKSGRKMKRKEIEARISKAVAQARKLLNERKEEYADIVESMLNGKSVGDCVAILVKRFSET